MKRFKTLLPSAALLLAMVAPTSALASDKGEEKAIDELWGTPVFVYGSALSQDQKEKTKELLGITANKGISYEEIKVSGEDMVRLLGRGNPKSNMFSSATIEYNKDSKGGILVEVVTPSNITAVTQTQYTNALITAGAEDVLVKVASPVAVTGQSALTGIYKAYENAGQELDQDRMEVAQQEIDVTSSISKENVNEAKFNTEMLTKTMVDIKETVAEEVLDGKPVTEVVATKIINEAVERNGLSDYITEEHVDKLVKFAMDYSKTDAAISTEVLDQLDALKDDAINKAKEFAESIGQKWEDVDKEGFFEGIKSFFNGIFSFFANIFKSEEPAVTETTPADSNTKVTPSENTVIDEAVEEETNGDTPASSNVETTPSKGSEKAEEPVVEESIGEQPVSLLKDFNLKNISVVDLETNAKYEFSSSLQLMVLERGLKDASKLEGIADMISPNYSAMVEHKDGSNEQLSLWLDFEQQTIHLMNKENTHAVFSLSESVSKKILKEIQP